MKEKTICLTFICRDNADVIERMLESCLPIIDCVIACDTGSKDNTIDLIYKFCRKNKLDHAVYYNEWKNFGHNRTLMMNHAIGWSRTKGYDYTFVMDTDEELIHLKKLDKTNMTGDVILINTLSGNMKYNRDRMFKNTHDWKWIGYAHEYPHSDTFRSKQFSDSLELKLEPKVNNNHIERNYKLLLQEKQDGLATSRTHFYLGQSAKDLGLTDDALLHFSNCVKETFWAQEKFFALYDMGRIYHGKKEYEQAKQYYLKAFNELPERIEPLYNLAVMTREQGLYSEAMIYLRFIEEKEMPVDGLFLEWAIYEYLVETELSICLYWTGDYSEAFNYCKTVQYKADKGIINDNGVIVQNLKNMAYTRLKLVENGNIGVLVIELPEGYDGLGDHLFFSHLPELAKKKGFLKVLVSNNNKYKTKGTKEVVWESNPFVDGFTDERGTYFDKKELFEILKGNAIVNNMPMLKQIAMVYNVYHDDYNGLPILYMHGRDSVFDLVQARFSIGGYLLYDGNWKHNIGIEKKDVYDYFVANLENYSKEFDVKYQIPELNEKALILNKSGWKTLPELDIESYISYIASAGRFVCLMSGGSVVSAALMRQAVVIDNDKTNRYYKFPQINIYLSMIYDA